MNLPDFSGRLVFVATALASALYLSTAQSAVAQNANLAKCTGLWFSTSEDFFSQGPRLPGGPVVSDGDLLSYEIGSGTTLCARNEELLNVFNISRYDHGLDALEKIEINKEVVFAAFSTEIDSVNGAAQFTAGDLLFSNGVVVPNNALLARFDLPRTLNLGLDAVHIEGAPNEKRELLAKLDGTDVDQLRENPGILIEILEGTNTDILFSTEGTPPEVQKPRFLDGDLLSARNGTIVRSNNDLLPNLPSGLPDKGVDYGLDAYTPAIDSIEQVPIEIFSTEIQARKNTISDGDALTVGPGIYLRNRDLINSLEPLDTDMGLDALAAGIRVDTCNSFITAISHVDVNARINPATGLFDGDRPFGRDIRVQGEVPGPECDVYRTHEFQVRVSIDGAPEQPVQHPASLNWMTLEAPCAGLATPYTSDPNGWFALTAYQRVVNCPNDESLAVWRSSADVPGDVATVDMRIVLRPIGGGPEVSSSTVRIRVDNKRPENVVMSLYKAGETDPFDNQCKIDGEGNPVEIDIRGTFSDDHFRVYSLSWSADGNIGGAVPQTMTRTYNSRPALSDTGTVVTPPETDALLERFDLTAAFAAHPQGGVLIECGYSIRMVVFDRARLGGMDWDENIFSIDDGGNRTPYTQSFCLVP
ncbi:hypothetical protein [uncultured Roseovarius sp.]|uniref:hypothetical protein n=1 Tax=uncultured Roseovarius sp. TaxID=293344 RepID=UPI0026391929|nr:hypothetical protein [uncultured Roseovarius sp.]